MKHSSQKPSQKILYSLLSLTSLLCLIFPQTNLLQAQEELGIQRLASADKPARMEVLLTHGINTDSASILAFLETGFPEATLRRGLPEQPEQKTTVANLAIQELGFLQEKAAVPLLLKIVKGEVTPGITNVLQRDTESLPLATSETATTYLQNILRFNSIVALGLIGDPAVTEDLYADVNKESDLAFALEGSIALALLGDARSLEQVSQRLQTAQPSRMHTGFQAVFFLTGRNYDVSQFASLAKRQQALAEFQRWFSENKSTWKPERESILRRRETGLVVTTPELGTTRGALRATKEFGNYDKRYTGRTFLKNRGDENWEEYKQISLDPLEELDIRIAAMEWYAASAPKEAKKDFKKLEEKDENPSIRDKARSLLEDIQTLMDKKKK